MADEIWTAVSYAAHNEAMREVARRHEEALRAADLLLDEERDRRYTEVNIEKEKALKIKETADLAALSLARESQTYKEQQNDALRDKNLSESGVYATNSSVSKVADDIRMEIAGAIAGLAAELKPLIIGQSQQQGQQQGSQITKGNLFAAVSTLVAVLSVGLAVFANMP